MVKKAALSMVLTGVALFCGSRLHAQCIGRAALAKFDRKEFIAAAFGKKANVSAEFLAAKGCASMMMDSLGKLGAQVKYSDTKVGYAFVVLPKENLLKTLDISGIEDATITHVYVDASVVPTSGRQVSALPAIKIPFPQVASTLPKDGPYFAADEAGLTALWKSYPEADGRGVRVAVVDGGIDLFHPALQKAVAKSGGFAAKVVDIDPVPGLTENGNWVRFGEPVHAINGTFTHSGRSWIAPADGTYRFGVYERKLVLGPEDNSHTTKITISVGVLWREQLGRVWVDSDGDGSFKNESALADYAESQDVGFFGTKDAENDNRIPFGVKIDRQNRAAYLAVANDGHGTVVSGPLAANRLTGGLFDGAAPNAQIVDVLFGIAKLPSILRAMSRPDVDIVNRSAGLARYRENGSEDFARHVLERAVVVYDKPLVCYCAGTNFFHVMDYTSGEMLRRNRQESTPYVDSVNSFVWLKPEGLINTVLAPSASLLTESRYLPLELQWEDGRRHTFKDDAFDPPAPAGYGIGSNPSPAIPIVTGVLADLVSEARRMGTRYTTARLYQALMTGARVVPGFSQAEQGYGVVNAAGAWDQLRKMASADDPANSAITSFDVSRKRDGRLKQVNGFSEEIAKPGGNVEGEVWITRHGGYPGGREFVFRLRGGDGVFTLIDQRGRLAPEKPVRVRFAAKVEPKLHVAFLQLVDAETDVVMEAAPLSIKGPDIPELAGQYVEKYQATTLPRHDEFGYVHLAGDVQAARFTMRMPYEGPELRMLPPKFRNRSDEKTPDGEPVDAVHHLGPMESFETLFANEKPSMREFYWENRGSQAEYETAYDEPPAPDIPVTGTVIVTKYAVGLAENGQKLTATNKLAEIDGRIEIFDAKIVSSSKSGTGTHAWVDAKRTLPEHLSQWRVRVSSNALAENGADVFLLNCTDSKNGCFVASEQETGKAGATLVVEEPKAGDWQIIVRTHEKTDKAVSYEIRETSLTPSPDPVETADSKHASGATWSVTLPAKRSDAQYAAFHIAGTSGAPDTQNGGARNGLRIGLISLDRDAPN
jgi:hypothetical protein